MTYSLAGLAVNCQVSWLETRLGKHETHFLLGTCAYPAPVYLGFVASISYSHQTDQTIFFVETDVLCFSDNAKSKESRDDKYPGQNKRALRAGARSAENKGQSMPFIYFTFEFAIRVSLFCVSISGGQCLL